MMILLMVMSIHKKLAHGPFEIYRSHCPENVRKKEGMREQGCVSYSFLLVVKCKQKGVSTQHSPDTKKDSSPLYHLDLV